LSNEWSVSQNHSLRSRAPQARSRIRHGVVTLLAGAGLAISSSSIAAAEQWQVWFPSNGYQLHGCITAPEGHGPYKAVIYTHGSERAPDACGPPALVSAYVARGYLFFAFQRHGHLPSPGEYILDLQKRIIDDVTPGDDRWRRVVALQDAYNLDVEGAVHWLMAQPSVDRDRVVMTGISFGGIQTLITAEKGLGLKAFLPFAPAAMSWERNPALRERLAHAASEAKAPVLIVQTKNDYSTGPSETLGPILREKGAPNDAKIYPTFGATPQDGHSFGARRDGTAIWGPEVFAFLDQLLGK
jgi:carboxymethylenebutenolidase